MFDDLRKFWSDCARQFLIVASVALGFLSAGSVLAAEGFTQEVIGVPHLQSGSLQTTVYRPEGSGPFPVVIINHGKGMGDPRDEPRYRAFFPSQEFLKRGYMVMVPMRLGFAGSSGTAKSYGCDLVKDGYSQASSIESVVAYAKERADVKKDSLLVVGQSYGGFASVAYGAIATPSSVKAIISFSGGLRKASGGCLWDQALYKAYAEFGEKSKIPTLWVYTENDGYFPPWLVKGMHLSYKNAGGQAELVVLPPHRENGHFLFDDRDGAAIWGPVVQPFLRRHQLP